ncbi:MAG: ABC transporter ATP-binding protein [Clostridia bacterium]
MAAIRTNLLSKQFKEVHAVENLSLTVPKGSVYGFLGPNGAGKTTTIKILTGFIKATSGDFEVMGRKISFGDTAYMKHIGFLPDVPAYYPYMTAESFLRMCAHISRCDGKNIPALLEKTDLAKHKAKKLSSYSRGMNQRLGIAQALINDPDILILDEPVSALDPMGRKDVLEIISRLKGEKTVFFSTHILSDVERICDHAAIIHNGKLVMQGTIGEIQDLGGEGSISLETDKNQEAILGTISGQDWCDQATLNGSLLNLRVNDRNKAGKEIPGILVRWEATLIQYQYARPTLEDIFVKVVNHQ